MPFARFTQQPLRSPRFLANFAVYHKRYLVYFSINKLDDLIVNCFFGHSPYLTLTGLARNNKVANGVLRYQVRGVLYLQTVIRFHDKGPNVTPFTPGKKTFFILRKYLTALHAHTLHRISTTSVINTLRTGLLNCLNTRSRGLIQSEVWFL